MASASLGETTFLVAYCSACAREVLTHIEAASVDDEIRQCLHCDALITTELKLVDAETLEARGYTLIDARTCGNGGGCSAGHCGMRQRA